MTPTRLIALRADAAAGFTVRLPPREMLALLDECERLTGALADVADIARLAAIAVGTTFPNTAAALRAVENVARAALAPVKGTP